MVTMTSGTDTMLSQAQQLCHNDRRVFASVLGFISLISCALAFLYRTCVRAAKQRKFPDNAFTIALMAMFTFHLTMLLGVFDGDAHLQNNTTAERVLCQFQAIPMHWSICSLMANAIYAVVALYLLVVRRVPLTAISNSTRWYFLIVFGLPTLTVGLCLSIGHGYGPTGNDDLCWIVSPVERYMYHLSYMVIGSVICLLTTPSILLTLFRAYRTVDEPGRARVFRSMMIRLVGVAIYVLFLFCMSVLTSMNNGATNENASTYTKVTAYTYCMVRTFMVESMGVSLAFILSVRKRHLQPILGALMKCTSPCRKCYQDDKQRRQNERRADDDQHSLVDDSSTTKEDREHQTDRSQGDQQRTSTRSPRGGLLCNSGAYSVGQTAVSIPPEPGHQRAHAIASNAYTTYILELAREELLAHNRRPSDFTDSHRTLDSLLSATDSSLRSLTSYVSAETPRRRRSSGSSAEVKVVVTEL